MYLCWISNPTVLKIFQEQSSSDDILFMPCLGGWLKTSFGELSVFFSNRFVAISMLRLCPELIPPG